MVGREEQIDTHCLQGGRRERRKVQMTDTQHTQHKKAHSKELGRDRGRRKEFREARLQNKRKESRHKVHAACSAAWQCVQAKKPKRKRQCKKAQTVQVPAV